MSQRVLGIDLGAHTVKVAELEVGFRTVSLTSLRTFEVTPGPGSQLQRSIDAVSGFRPTEPTDIVCVGMPGDRVLTRLFEVPFSDVRKVQAVVAGDLADDLPWEAEDIIFDVISAKQGGQVLVAAALRSEVGQVLEQLSTRGLEPKQLAAAPLSYAALVRRLHPDEAVLLIDLGHVRTNVCLIGNGRALIARTISRGGHQITEALRQLYQLSYEEAERLKCSHAFVANDQSELDAAQQRVATATVRAIAPLVREIRRTLAVAGARTGVVAERVLLCGGTSQLTGLSDYLEQELGLPTTQLDMEADPDLSRVELSAEGQAVGALSLSLALDYGRRQSIDFRQSEFAFKADRSFFRDRLLSLAASVFAVLLCASLSAWATMHSTQKEAEALTIQLREASRGTFGKPVSDPREVSRRVKAGAITKGRDIPSQTAVSVLQLISETVPARGKVQLDIKRLDIEAGKTRLRGTADSRAAVGKIIEALNQVPCFSDGVKAGRISEVAEGKKEFSLDIMTKCF